MSLLPFFSIFVGLVVLIVLLSFFRPPWVRTIITILFIGVLGLSYTAVDRLLGLPRPINETMALIFGDEREITEAVVVADYQIPHKAIYLLLLVKDDDTPVYYEFEWTAENADRLQKAKEFSERTGGVGIMMKNPFEKSLENRPWEFEPIRPERGPQKQDAPINQQRQVVPRTIQPRA